MILDFSSSATYELSAPTLVVLMVEPTLVGTSHRIISEHLRTTPVESAALWRDVYDNPARHFMAPPGSFSFTFEGQAEVTPSGIVPDDASRTYRPTSSSTPCPRATARATCWCA